MTEPRFLETSTVLDLHDELVARHGGLTGLHDEALLDSALNRPVNRFAYTGGDLFDCASSYAFWIARNHPFHDGNKRTAWGCYLMFLDGNGVIFGATIADAVEQMIKLASGEFDEPTFAEWLRTLSSNGLASPWPHSDWQP